MGPDLRRPRPRRRRPGRPRDRARLLRGPSGEMVDHEGHDLRLDHPATVSRLPRTEPLEGSRRHDYAREAVRAGVSSPQPAPADAEGHGPEQQLARRIDTIEEAYEFFLAYASQGHPSDHASARGEQIRQYLHKCDGALTG